MRRCVRGNSLRRQIRCSRFAQAATLLVIIWYFVMMSFSLNFSFSWPGCFWPKIAIFCFIMSSSFF
tara:strand:- start:100 stop:297 length:198 start_codon:yes stop_codon:yes gene_type:complete